MCQDVSERSSWWFWQVESRLLSFIAWLWQDIAPCQGNFVPLPGKKRYVGRKDSPGLSFRFDHPSRPVIMGRSARKMLLSFLPFTLHLFACNPDKHWGCERWRVASALHHPSPSHCFERTPFYRKWLGHHWCPAVAIIDDQLQASMVTGTEIR